MGMGFRGFEMLRHSRDIVVPFSTCRLILPPSLSLTSKTGSNCSLQKHLLITHGTYGNAQVNSPIILSLQRNSEKCQSRRHPETIPKASRRNKAELKQ